MSGHEPTPSEQESIDQILEQFNVELVPVRLTNTMLVKSIIDARAPIRYGLRQAGIVEYELLVQGPQGRIQRELPLVTHRGVDMRTVSFYRPATKKGDPRVWIERLASEAHAGDLLLFGFSGTTVLTILLSALAAGSVVGQLTSLLPSRYEGRGQLEATVRRLHGLIAPLATRWVPTMRPGPTGVGFTFETLLGIEANSSQAADIDGVELKAYRRGAISGPGKLVTLFSKTPIWLGPDKGKGLLDRFGYFDDNGRRSLYCTITKSRNTLGFRLEPSTNQARMLVRHQGDDVMAYGFATLAKRLAEKHPATLFVKAESRGAGAAEEFRYDDVTLCRQPSFSNFLDLVDEDRVGLDLTLHLKENGRARDHGYLWRIREASIPSLFAYRRRLTADPA